MGRFGKGFCIRQEEIVALRGSEQSFLRVFFSNHPESLKSALFSKKMPCGNDMIATSVENLMDSKADHRFTTVVWKSFGLFHNPLDKCYALTHITTSLTTADLICHKN